MKTFERDEDSILTGSDTHEDLMNRAQDVTSSNRADQQFQTYQIPVGTTPTPVAMQPDGFITVMNLGAVDVFLGNAQVSALSGFLLAGTKGKAIKIKTRGDVYAIAAAPATISVAINAEVDVAN